MFGRLRVSHGLLAQGASHRHEWLRWAATLHQRGAATLQPQLFALQPKRAHHLQDQAFLPGDAATRGRRLAGCEGSQISHRTDSIVARTPVGLASEDEKGGLPGCQHITIMATQTTAPSEPPSMLAAVGLAFPFLVCAHNGYVRKERDSASCPDGP